VRTVDPKTFAVSTVALPEDVSMIGSWFASAYDEEGNGYLFCGSSLTGFYKLSFVDGSMTCTVLAEGPIVGEEGEGSGHGLSADGDGFVSVHQDGRMVAGPTKSGIIASGPVMTDEAGVVTADTYTVAWGGTSFEPTDRQMSVTKMYDMAGTTYRGRFYVIGASESEVGGWVFASEPVETFAQPGDAPEPDEPSEPGSGQPGSSGPGPSGSGQPGSSGPGQPGSSPVAQQSSGPSARQASSTSKLPKTGGPRFVSSPLLAMLGVTCLIATAIVRLAGPSARITND
jgi:hypothetical protein